MRWKHTVNDILVQHKSLLHTLGLNSHQLRHLFNISQCHTPALGGEVIACKDCHHRQFIYRSCRNRHCPSCQGSKREQWILKQQEYLIKVPYFHVVFTIPHELNGLCLAYPKHLYNILFKASWQTIYSLSKDIKFLGAKPGMTAVLHTWGQNISLHPHLHCIVPGGGVDKAGLWKFTRSEGKYLFPVKVLTQIYRGIFMKLLKDLHSKGVIDLSDTLREKLYRKRWVVYCKRPFLTPAHVIEYLGRYTHKIAISNYRLRSINNNNIVFSYKDYRQGAKVKEMTLTVREFIRRFALHILPHRFVRIRHYGILSNHGRKYTIPLIQDQQEYLPLPKTIVQKPIIELKCEMCHSSNLATTILAPIKIRDP